MYEMFFKHTSNCTNKLKINYILIKVNKLKNVLVKTNET